MALDFKWDEVHLAEEPADALLRELGYEFVPAEVLDAERESLAEPVLVKRLEAALRRLNPWISDDNVRKAIRHITHAAATGLIEANEQVHTALVHNISLEQDLGQGIRGQTVRFIDFDDPTKNEFVFTRQYRVSGTKQTAVPDIVVFVNGIPIVVIECKSPTINDPLDKAIEQLFRYQEVDDRFRGLGAPRLFHAAQILIGTCGQAAKYGTIGTPARNWSEWKVPHPLTLDQLGATLGRVPTPQDVLLWGLLNKGTLLDLVQNFIVFEVDGARTYKKLARFPQFIAVNGAIERIRKAKRPTLRGGIVWHTQGSGKSLTMVFLAVKLRRLGIAANPTLIVVTDRKDLDNQITGTFQRCGFPNPVQARNVRHLRELLNRGGGQTVMTTVQKFQEAATEGHPVLNTAENVFVMVDEAHRTQYRSLAANMRRALPNACFLGFTGTPIDKKDRSTLQVFGDYIHKYTIEQAVQDGATVPIFYEMRQSPERIEGESLDAVFERIFRDRSDEERETIKQRFATQEAVAAAPRRIEAVCLDIIDHFEKFIHPNGFKAQVVACSRDVAVTYKETLDRLSAPESALIMSSTHNDPERLARWRTTKEDQRKLIGRFKDPEDPLAILVVCDMLITGFDAPVEQVMYLDAPLREHTLLQAIARVNRTAEGKDYGLVVDYWGVALYLEQALSVFAPSDVQGAMRPKADLLPRLESYHRTAMRFFSRIGRDDVEGCIRILEPEDARAEYELAFRRFAQAMDMLLPDPAALPFMADLKWLGKVRNAARVRFRDSRFDLTGCRAKVRALIEEHIAAGGVEQLLEPVSILAPEFEDEMKKLGSDEARASEMEHAIRHEIHVRMDENPVFYGSLQERLAQIIEERRQARVGAAEQLRLLGDVVRDMKNVHATAQAVGLDEAGFAIYELLGTADGGIASDSGTNASADVVVDGGRRDQAAQILADLQDLAVIDWVHKEDVQRRMRQAVKRNLRGAGYPREQLEALTAKLMDLARVRLTR
ncbi:MAG: DEAD/DEAH box helicase [Deltaproteobacteria bacterium RIFOXYA12_FULL_61_11]|nr:MAG: DEAD/DEAH box helicase [Deltaproteobacteria bacterium RIFOXYA12_FULL_61_11]